MDLNLEGKRAIVCGSTQGIGRAAAIEIAKLGASITLVARSEEKLAEVLGELPTDKGQAHSRITADFENPGMLRDQVKRHIDDGNPATILVNNTGGPPGGPIVEANYDAFLKAFDAHLHCSHLLVQTLLPEMKSDNFGRIINVISTSVKIPIPGLGVSNTTRGAMASWSKTLAGELAPYGITVNNVLPGFTKTGRLDSIIESRAKASGKSFDEVQDAMVATVPAGRLGRPDETAALICFPLASPAAGYISGTNIPVDGARTGTF